MTSIATDDALARRSIQVLKAGQAGSGAFVASPSFPTYHFAWLRDGAFCAYALDLVGEREAAAAFQRWVADSVESHRPMIESVIARVQEDEIPHAHEMPPARFTVDGALETPDPEDPWPNFQVDGYGMWLWALNGHVAGELPAPLKATVELVARYLAATWPLESFSCWEELDGGEHASTLGAAIAGLDAAAVLLDDAAWVDRSAVIRDALLRRFVHEGGITRGPDDHRVDGSELWLGVPFGVVPVDDPRLEETVRRITRELYVPGGGVYRYRGDTYYGGGEWPLLACSLAWHCLRSGEDDVVDSIREWVRAQADENGDLPEQVATNAQDPSMVEPWIERWGPSAKPLLWSHAMYLIMEMEARR
jgi:GH15 family glucan-1,4-alpha-glucosidase